MQVLRHNTAHSCEAVFKRRKLVAKLPSEVLKKTKQKDEDTSKDDKDDKKKPGRSALLSWIATKKK
jgi:hypothetical protein